MYYSDSVASQDLLDRKQFAKDIALSIVNNFSSFNESVVIGINGKWGSGKSTLLSFIKNEIIEQNNVNMHSSYLIFSFNPWMFSGQRELQASFLSELSSAFGDIKGEVKDLAKKIASFIDKLGFVKYLHSGLGEFQKDSKGFLEKLSKEESIEKKKADVDRLIIESGFRLYIFLDDLDRLMPDELVSILQLVKLNANFKNTVFFLAYDTEVVNQSLKKHFGHLSNKYLEKIVQVDYTIPEVLSERIEDIFFERLDNLFSENKIDFRVATLLDVWDNKGLKFYFKTLRDVYRYINAINLRLPAIYNDINIGDFLIVEAIRIFDYEAYISYYKYNISLIESVGTHKAKFINNPDTKPSLRIHTQSS